MKNKLKRIIDLIDNSKKLLITSHRDPDGDSIGSQLALAYLAEKRRRVCRIINQGKLPYKYIFLDPERKIENVEVQKDWSNAVVDVDLVFVLDCTSRSRMGEVAKIIPAHAYLVNIDHHADNEKFGMLNYVDSEASAVGEIIFTLIKTTDIPLVPRVAAQLYATILTDTGRFKFSNTSSLCLRICAELLDAGAIPWDVTNQIYFNHPLAFLKLLGKILSNPEVMEENKVCVMTLRRKTIDDLGIDPKEVEGLVNYSLFLQGAEIGLLFTEQDNKMTKVNLRSQNEFNVAQVARVFGGGGHRNAAGCTLSCNLEEAKRKVVERILRILRNEPVGSLDN